MLKSKLSFISLLILLSPLLLLFSNFVYADSPGVIVYSDENKSLDKDGYYCVHLQGFVNSIGSYNFIIAKFNYGETIGYGSNTSNQSIFFNGTLYDGNIVSGLDLTKTYHYRASVQNGTDISYSGDETFKFVFPAIATNNITSVTNSSATFNGNITNLGDIDSYYYYWQYGGTILYGATSAIQTGYNIGNLSYNMTGLQSSTTYHCRLVIKNGGYYTYGDDYTFTTDVYTGPSKSQIDLFNFVNISPIIWIGIVILLIFGLFKAGVSPIIMAITGGIMVLLGSVGSNLISTIINSLLN